MMYRTRLHRRTARRGSAAVELAFSAPLLVGLLLGIWEVGRLVDVQQVVGNAVREGARQASTGTRTVSDVQQTVRTYLQRNGINIDSLTVTVENLTASSRPDPTGANQLDRLRVTASMPFDSVRWILLSQITSTTKITSTADWFSMKDIPLNVSTTVPIE